MGEKIKNLPEELRPRERLLRHGPESLNPAELLAVLLGSGTPQENALELALRLLTTFGGLKGLIEVHPEQLKSFKGIGQAKAAKLLAALELARRYYELTGENKLNFLNPDDVYNYLRYKIGHKKQEQVVVLYLNTKNQLCGENIVAIGGVNHAGVSPGDIFREAVKIGAYAVIIAHNHPSGDPTPSKEDIDFTGRVKKASEILGIKLLDHIILGENKYISMKAERLF
ncbi:RadC family protein [Carboxydothermus hydrogenoformans]|uniref:UPF0758 protein CHY_0341 n=1 Tax=Carboxydothermus hydrogenoformans (strain ATCC BAA-161 / DSM 6008 / Z-2901) TaxID=246194 RepID=Y341_CARHZ|nr:DNA repair protein RadC [Carboxydothermus hydrogenoformans]Q3AF80.1 RecName: Full=UPF0758 protein CHY_0341 [Carboxydothermus hydrogenoformans Z-2901]ABB13672.1 DNA repair protein RadC [Carboxydothermus hydrogenoformans Z-2901]